MFDNISERRQRTLLYIAKYLKENNYPPSYRDIQTALGVGSTSTVSSDIHALIKQGYLEMDKGNYRSIRLTADVLPEEEKSAEPYRDDVYDIPVFGDVAAGAPIFADDYIEDTIPLPKSFFRAGEKYFVLRISGESMIEAGICDGDYVIVKKQDTARNGDQVVALIEDSATVKTYFRRADHIELRPENSSMEPIRVRSCRILGIVCGLYRIYR